MYNIQGFQLCYRKIRDTYCGTTYSAAEIVNQKRQIALQCPQLIHYFKNYTFCNDEIVQGRTKQNTSTIEKGTDKKQ